MTKYEDRVVISGIGQSEVGRRLDRSALALTIDAITAAIADAGLTPTDVDGLVTYPGGGTALGPGFAGPSLAEVYDALGLDIRHWFGGFDGPAQLGPVVHGSLAISSALARHVVVYRTVTEGSARTGPAQPEARDERPGSPAPLISPFSPGPAPITWALAARRHFHDYGTTREQLAQVALTARRHAQLNPAAVYRDPLGLDDYLAARMVADPLCLFDCDVHCDGSTAIVLSHVDHAPDAPRPIVGIEAIGTAPPVRSVTTQHAELHPGGRAAEQMWARTDLGPTDVDVAEIYDGFSILTLLWLEALGFCGRGEAGTFVESGRRITLDGELPLNTQGGQLSGGRLHGLGFVHEACLQLRGDAGERQAGSPSVAVVAVGASPYVGCMLLRAGRA